MYFGNQTTLLHFNGNDWQAIEIPKLTVRSLAKDNKGTIYVGSIGDFGYLEPNLRGEFVYKSLLDKLPESLRGFTDVWATFVIEKRVYYCSAIGIYKFENNKLIHFYQPSADNTFHKFFVTNKKFYVRENGVGILTEENNNLAFVKGSAIFKDQKIDAFIHTPNGIFIATRNGSLFNYSQNKFTEIIGSAQKELLDADIYSSLLLHNGLIALGSLKKGIFIIDTNGNLVSTINDESGLKVNKVHYLYEDKNNNLWAALEKGIAMIEYFSPFTKFDETSGLEGNVNAAIKFKNRLYVGTTQGLFFIELDSKNKEPFTQIMVSDACYYFLIVKSKDNKQKLITSMKSGLYELYGQEPILIDSREFTILYQPNEQQNCFYAGGIDLLSKFELKKNGFENTLQFDNIEGKVVSMISKDNKLFVGSEGSGVYTTNTESTEVALHKINTTNINLDSKFLLFNLNNEIYYATSSNGFYKYARINNKDTSIASHLIDQIQFSNKPDIYQLKTDNKKQIWMFYTDEFSKKKLVISYLSSNGKYVLKNENFSKMDLDPIGAAYLAQIEREQHVVMYGSVALRDANLADRLFGGVT
jgi:hypothetical protein